MEQWTGVMDDYGKIKIRVDDLMFKSKKKTARITV